uniref:Uncharacterized protein n=1 Tax=Sus scrofa TaxID=9823 RepID=A0A4X1UFV4_PIG
ISRAQFPRRPPAPAQAPPTGRLPRGPAAPPPQHSLPLSGHPPINFTNLSSERNTEETAGPKEPPLTWVGVGGTVERSVSLPGRGSAVSPGGSLADVESISAMLPSLGGARSHAPLRPQRPAFLPTPLSLYRAGVGGVRPFSGSRPQIPGPRAYLGPVPASSSSSSLPPGPGSRIQTSWAQGPPVRGCSPVSVGVLHGTPPRPGPDPPVPQGPDWSAGVREERAKSPEGLWRAPAASGEPGGPGHGLPPQAPRTQPP